MRLLTIHPGKPDDNLKMDLMTVDLANPPPYQTISYVWGDCADQRSLLIGDTPVRIHAGLFNALHAVRSSSTTTLVWADGTCINQNDLEEKGS